MALNFSDSAGNLFNRLGSIAEILRELRVYQTAVDIDMTNATTGVTAQFAGEADLQAIMGANFRGGLRAAEAIGSTGTDLAVRTVDRMVYRDSPRPGQTLEGSSDLSVNLQEVIRQMKQQGATIQVQTVAAAVNTIAGQPGPHFTGDGNGITTVSTRRADGLVQENLYAETLLVTCSADSYTGNTTAGNELVAIQGPGRQENPYAFDWPGGSNASIDIQAIDGSQDNSRGNLLTNSGFDTFTVTNTPDNWVIAAGAVTTDIFSESTLLFGAAGSKALRIVGDGTATNFSITQTFNSTTGTGGELEPITQYSCNLFMRRDAIAIGSGVLTVDLIDGGDTVIQDDEGNNNSFTVDLTALTISYQTYSGVFRLPHNPPASIRLRLRLTTLLTTGRSVYLDRMSLGAMALAYTGGPSLAIHSGTIPFVVGDLATVTLTNDRGNQSNLASFGPVLQRFFDLASLDLLFPSAAAPTISDQLIG